ncbi:MAG TPA: transcriptional regulator [Micromonosporaceae bacterium]|nr:transcriptional regulator [Micromonosporaceae bacterium]
MSVRAFAAHLGVAVASVTNWEQRGERIRLRHETQEILDTDLSRAPDEVRDRFEAALNGLPAASASPLTHDGAQRLEYVLAHPGSVDLVTVAYLRERVAELDADYDHAPSASLLGAAGQRHGQIAFLRVHAGNARVQRDLYAAVAESATLMGQLVWDASLRRDHEAALSYFDQAAQAADECGDPISAARAQLRRSYVALYGQKNPVAGLEMATQAATTSRTASNVLAGLAMLHVAEAHAMRQHAQSCEDALSAADTHFGKIGEADEAAPLFAPTDLSRMAGSCYLYLDDAPRAAHFLTDSLRRGGGQTKAAAVAAANLALAHARQGKIDEAVGSLHQAIDIVEATRGGGGLTVAFSAGRALSRWRSSPAVQDVHDRLLTLMAA